MAISKVKSVFSTYTLDDSLENKNYHRVLFKPGVSVQARELTELQTNLQRQIDYHGQYAFKEGSRVTGGEVTLNVDYDYIKVESSMTTGGTAYNSAGFISTIANTAGATLTNANGVVAEVIQVISEAGVDLADGSNKTGILDSGNTSDPLTLYIKYVEGSGDTESNTFAVGEVLTSSTNAAHKLMVGGGTDTNGSGLDSTITNAIGKGSKVSLNEGVYFISGNFVYVSADSIILEKYDNTPSNIIGLNITESVITSVNDTTLVDNAAGYPNASAPGAERYKIATQLIKEPLASPNSAYTNYNILLKVENGIQQVETASIGKDDTELTKRFARRTNEESGNYALKPFILDIKEHLDDGTNNGYKTSGNSGDAGKYVVGIEPNTAYVQGYRTENIATKFVEVDKPREVSTAPFDYVEKPNATSILNVGNYIKVDISSNTSSVGFPDITNFSEMALIDSAGGASGAIALVDTIAMTHTGTGAQQGTYYVTDGDSHTTGANGSNAKFKIIIDNQSKVTVEVIAGGSGYNVNSTFTILGTKFTGGATSANDLTFDVAQLGHGRARCRGVTYESASILRLHLFDIVMTSGQFTQIDKVEQLTAVTGGGTFSGDLVGASDGIRYDAENNSAVYKLPFTGIKNAEYSDKPVYQIQKRLFIDDAGAADTHTFSNVLDADENLLGTTAIISIGSGTGADVRTTTAVASQPSGTKNVKIDHGDIADDVSLCVIITAQKAGNVSHLKTKTFTTVTDTLYKYDGSNPILLNAYDIYSIVSIKQGATDGPDITDQFELDNGQRANFYDEGRLIPTSNIAAGNVYITFYHYTHSTGEYCTINSYDFSDANHKAEDVPQVKLPNGESVDLKDCIDFRPVKGTIGVHSNNYSNINDSAFNPDSTNSVLAPPIAPGSILTVDAHVWMPRIDKLVLSRDGAYSVIKGISSENPVPPEDPQDSMVIGLLRVKPYTYDAKTDVLSTLNNHKRYTMRQIGDIDKRVKNLEYYSSLSLLENEALNISIPDTSSATNTFERFKNGIFVEPFTGHSNANVFHPNHNCAIDRAMGVLRPKFDQQNVNLVRKSGDTGVVLNGSLYTLPFNSVDHIKQPYATTTEFVNPYNVFTWAGTVELSPDTDEWKDVEHRPDVIINDDGQYDQLVASIEESGVLGTVWNEWETNWTGVDSQVSTSTSSTGGGRRIGFTGRWGFSGWTRPGTTTNTTTTTTTTTNQSRSGLNTRLVSDTETTELGSKVVETNFIPFIRSREIYFKAQMLKPNTKVYAFFNEIDVTGYCGEKSFVEFSEATQVVTHTDKTAHDAPTALVSDSAGIIEGSFYIPNNSGLRFKTGVREFRLTDSSVNNKDDETTYAETNYFAQGLLETKENTIISTKVPRLVTSEVNDSRVLTDRSVDTQSRTTWSDPLAQTFLIDQRGGLFATVLDIFVRAKDSALPLNVSIREVENGIPTQRIIPGSETVLYPGTSGSAANTIYDNMITENGSVACPVTFKHPVYLAQDTEYAIVLMSNSDTYKVFIAEMGGFDLQNASNRVTKQPYNGVFFTSQNASTWTPEQNRDLKFTLKRANFTSSGATLVYNNDRLPVKRLKGNPLFICSGSTSSSAVIRVSHPNHGMMEGSSVTIAGSTAIESNKVTAANINSTHVISDVERDSYVITVTAASQPTELLFGGGTSVTATENMTIDTLIPYNQLLQLPETNITYQYKGFTARSIDGSQGLFVKTGPHPISINNNNFFNNPIVIASAAEHSANTGELGDAGTQVAANKSLGITCTFTTSNSYLSPVIDANRSSVFCISNRTNDATSNSGSSKYNKASHGRTYVADTASKGNSNLNNYITREITLANEASQLDVYADVYKPAGSDIQLYYKVKEAGSDSNFDDLDWTLLDPKETIPEKDADGTNVEYQVNLANVATLASTFASFAFKIVLTTNNSANPPMVSNFRAIATT